MNDINKFIKSIFFILITIPFIYLAIATYSYISVISTFGTVPISHNYTPDLIKSTGKKIVIFPTRIGSLICLLYILWIWITPVFVIAILLIGYFTKTIVNFKRLLISLTIIYLLLIFLTNTTEFASWYLAYVLD